VKRPARTHCQTCEREISAVAASSVRLSIAAAPTPAAGVEIANADRDVRMQAPWRDLARQLGDREQVGLGHVHVLAQQLELVRVREARPCPVEALRCLPQLVLAAFSSATRFTSASLREGMN
jgi:hypothetical protein